jgi:hypothetical protein
MFLEEVMTHLLCDTASDALLSSDVRPMWNVKGQAVRQAAQGLSFLVHSSNQEYKQ